VSIDHLACLALNSTTAIILRLIYISVIVKEKKI
jgi:hypothetical protein